MPPTNPPPTGAVIYSQQYRRCGKPDCQACRPGRPGHGPYWYARWQEGGRTRTRYIGKEAPPDVSDRSLPMTPAPPVTVEGKDVVGQAQGGVPGRRANAGKTTVLSGLAPTPTPPALRVRTLGGFTVWRGDRELAPGCWSRRTVAALFKCLLTAPAQRLAREQAADLLWPDADRDQSGVNLRAAIHRLRAVLDEPGAATSYLRSERSILILDPHPGSPAQQDQDQDWLDADAFARAARLALAGGDIAVGQAALDLYGGEYLPDDPYEDWAAARREELRQQYHALLLRLARLSADAGDSAGAVWRLRLLLAADPCHEPATRLLMRLLAANGDRAEALRAYEVLVRALRDDLDVVPTPETESLHAMLRAAAARAAPRTEPQTTPTNLPAALTSFVGRGRELAAVEHGLAQGPGGCRLLTLTGVGGGGKTRLALEVAAAVRPHYPDGVWLVELAALADPTLVPATVAAALALRELPGASFTEAMAALADTLQARRMLLVLDNCEHLVAACAGLAARLLRACPHLQILATSREALGIAGETVWRLPPLSLPPLIEDLQQVPRMDALPGRAAENVVVEAAALDRLQRFEAVQLFVERARASRPDFTLTRQNAAAVAQICRRLDGLPLAIELAAARLSALSARDVAARLDDRFRLLTAGNRAALPRHQTLRGVLDWSYTLLNAPEQALLRRLAVFAGGWTIEAAETVCAGGPVGKCDVLDLLAGLEAKSLVTLGDDPAPPSEESESRYGLLETVRQYAADHLAANGELDAAGGAHAAYILTLAERAEPGLYGPRQRYWLDRLEAEHDNIRAALAWSTREGEGADAQTAARLTGALGWFWRLHGHLNEGRRWLTIVLSKECGIGDDASRLRAGALNAAGMLAERQHDYAPAEQALQESVARYRALGDDQGMADALNNLGHVVWDRSDNARAHPLFQESLSLRRTLGDERGVASSLNNLARVHRYQGDVEAATALYEQSVALWKRVGEPWGIATVLGNLGLEMGERGDYQRALSLHQESLALRRELGDKMGVSWSLTNVASIDTRLGNYERAVTLFEESLQLARQLGDKATVTDIVEGLAEVAQAREEMGRAARLFGGVAVLRAAVGDPLSPAERARYNRNVAVLRAALGEDRFTMLWREGQAMTLEEIIAYARKHGATS